jgi:hypothetical protein
MKNKEKTLSLYAELAARIICPQGKNRKNTTCKKLNGK